jgi:hypothetical protein
MKPRMKLVRKKEAVREKIKGIVWTVIHVKEQSNKEGQAMTLL